MSDKIRTSPNSNWSDKKYRENFPKDMGKPEIFIGVDKGLDKDFSTINDKVIEREEK